MTKREALKQGLYYTGMAFRAYDSKTKEYYKNKVADYKSKYKVRLVLVNEGNGFFAYFADDNFSLVQFDAENLYQQTIDNYDKNVEYEREKFEAKIKELTEQRDTAYERLEKIKQIKK